MNIGSNILRLVSLVLCTSYWSNKRVVVLRIECIRVSVYAYVCRVCGCSREEKRFLQTSKNAITGPGSHYRSGLLSFWKIYDFESSLENRRNILFIRTYRLYENDFRSTIFGGLCNFIENLIARAINNVKHFQNVQSFTWIGYAFICAMCSGFKQIMQSIKWRWLLIALITIKILYIERITLHKFIS